MTTYDFRALGFQPRDVAVVTGAGNGIGRAVALMLAKSGLTVAGWDLEKDAVEGVVAEIESAGGAATSIIADLAGQDGNRAGRGIKPTLWALLFGIWSTMPGRLARRICLWPTGCVLRSEATRLFSMGL